MADGEGPVVLRPRPIVGTFPTPLGGGSSGDEKPTALATTSSVWRSPLSPQQQPRQQQQNPPAEDTGAGSNEEDKAETGDGGGARSGNAGVAASPPAFRAAHAACGQSHTVLVSAAGEAWACGRNRSGQLGLDPAVVPEAYSPVHVPLPMGDAAGSGGSSGRGRGRSGSASRLKVVQAAAGRAHTILLRSNGYVLGFGSDEFGALGVSQGEEAGCIPEVGDGDEDENALATAIPDATDREEEAAAAEVSQPPVTWQPREIPALKGQWVASISAGGEQSFALVVGRTQQTSSTSLSSSSSSPSSYGVAASTAGPLLRSGGQEASGTATDETSLASAAASASASSVPSASKLGVVGNPATTAGGGGSGGGSFSVDLSGPISRQGSQAMFLRRRFSLPPALKMRTAAEFMELIEQARGAGAGANDGDIIGPVAEATVLEVGGDVLFLSSFISSFLRTAVYRGVCVCFLPIHSGHQVRWTYQPGSHRRKVTQDF